MASAPPPAPMSEDEVIRLATKLANERGIPPQIAIGLVRGESGGGRTYDPDVVGDRGRAFGLTQIHRPAAEEVGMDMSRWADPAVNIGAGLDYLSRQKARFSDWPRALQAYNAGPGSVARGDVPPSAVAYAQRVLGTTAGAGKGTDFPPPPYEDTERQMSTDVQPNQTPYQGRMEATDTFIPPPGMEDLQGGGIASDVKGGFGRTPGIVEIAGAKEPGGFSGLLSKIGGGLAKALPYLIGGPYYAMAKHVVGPLAEEQMSREEARTKRLEEFKSGREQRTRWENAQVDKATKMMEDLQGLNLTALLEQEKDPQHKALLQQAADRIHAIGKKYAELMSDPQSPGMITPKEANELLAMQSMFSDELNAAKEASGLRTARMTGVAKSLEEAGQEAGLEERAGAEPGAAAKAKMGRLTALGETVPIDIGGGRIIHVPAVAWAQMMGRQGTRVPKDPNTQLSMFLGALKTAQLTAVQRNDREKATLIGAQIHVIEQQLRDISSGKYGTTVKLPGGYSLDRDEE